MSNFIIIFYFLQTRHVENTASIVQALVLFKRLHPGHREKEIEVSVSKAVRFLEGRQWPDGSWLANFLKIYEENINLFVVNY